MSETQSSYNKACPNPPSTTLIKYVLWGQSINTDISLNLGQDRCDFKVLVGSNYYIKHSARQNLSEYSFFGPRGEYMLAPWPVEPFPKAPVLVGRASEVPQQPWLLTISEQC